MSVRVIGDRILVKRAAAKTETEGGIVLPAGSQGKSNEGVVLAVGTGRWTITGKFVPLSVAPGETVFFGRNAGADIEVDGERLVVIRDEDLLVAAESEA